MHRSRLQVVLIDSAPDVAETEVAFWAAALGRDPLPEPDTPFTVLAELGPGQVLVHQRLQEGPSRIHLDIETDDIEAEVKRLEALGARRVAFVKRWWVLEAPTGQRFCVVRPQRGPLNASNANAWGDGATTP